MSRPPHLLLVGASHHRASLAVRERLTLPTEKQAALVSALRASGRVGELCLLNTCNRVEIYATADDPGVAEAIAAEFCRLQNLVPEDFATVAQRQIDAAAVSHLFAVAAGLDSQIVGETEILGQAKEAYDAARAAGTTGKVLNRVFQKAFHCAKIVRTETAVGEGPVSVATVAAALAEKIFGRLAPSRVLLVGAGEISERTAKALRSREVRDLRFANRTAARAADLARELGGGVLPFERLAEGLREVDIVICSTAAPQAVVSAAMIRAAMHVRPSRPLFLIDLAVPRDVEPAAAELTNVFLYNLDDLARLADENLAHRRAEVDRARQLIAERARDVWRNLAGADGSPARGPG